MFGGGYFIVLEKMNYSFKECRLDMFLFFFKVKEIWEKYLGGVMVEGGYWN